ncbi:hypothetical protein ACFL1R_09760 [Candidatus Latescibacterota bacterium]
MKFFFSHLLLDTVIVLSFTLTAEADTIMSRYVPEQDTPFIESMLNMSDDSVENVQKSEATLKPAIWPFSKSDDSQEIKPKSPRKAFFLSFLMPGLGEAYVGSKRSFLFLGIEAVAWWLYMTNTNEGNDLEADFQQFANDNWHYTDTVDSRGEALDFNYWEWIKYHFREVGFPDDMDPHNHALIDSLMEETVQRPFEISSISGHSVHNLPSTKTQQYYEMIGKYPQFVYGWEDIDDVDKEGNLINPTVRKEDGTIKYDEDITIIKSPLRMKYEDMRDDSNKKLRIGQRGIHLMLINRVISSIDAARLAYHHNIKLDSELSMIRVNFVQKHIIDNKVPMIVFTKNF